MMLKAPELADIESVEHGFFTRQGGVSSGPWASLNVGLRNGDRPEAVAANRARCSEALRFPSAALATARQVHGVDCVTVDTPWGDDEEPPSADGLVTRRAGVLLGVVTADCAPILLADPAAGVIGACHAGWRGALAGIAEATLDAMCQLGARADRVTAVIGPCIAQASYEVGPDLRDPFVRADPAYLPLFAAVPGSDRWLFDLKGFLELALGRAGVRDVAAMAEDTCADEARFFSYRRRTKRQDESQGLQLSAIGIRA